jgi:hypothetical protein
MKKIVASLFISVLFFSCSSDEAKSSENYIEEFEIIGISPIEINVKQGQSLIYIWTEASEYEKLPNANKRIALSLGASLDSIGNAWTAPDFKYIIRAENGYVRSYSVQIDTDIPKKYSFESWTLSDNGINGYYIPSDLRWASGNPGISMALAILGVDVNNPENHPTRKTEDGYIGNAVIMETMIGGNVFGRNVPLFSGNFFLGNFNVIKAITDELAATEVGRIYPAKPKSVKGWYKYKEGKEPFLYNGIPQSGRHDSCNLHISFYQSDLPDGKDITLTVRDIDTSDLVIADATLEDCSETPGNGFHPFTLPFGEYKKEPDFENHRYKIAITFAASRNGDKYAGKIGSTLIVDEVEIEDY